VPAKDQKVTHDSKTITINRPTFKCLASVTYTEDLYNMVVSTTWTRVTSETGKDYLKSTKYGLLHQLVIRYFYGEDVLNEAYKNNYVIDHLDNNGYECTYENLTLIPKKENSAKGLTYDIERAESIRKFAINITKDFDTGEFQISIAFNQLANIRIGDEEIPLVTLYLRYGTEYKTAFIDARSVLNDLNEKGSLNFSNLRHKGFDYRKAEVMFATHEEIASGFVIRDGQIYGLQGSQHTFMIKPNHSKELHKDITKS
jgi:hypothetical protein